MSLRDGIPLLYADILRRIMQSSVKLCVASTVFREDFLQGYELSHDILCPSRSDDNRRAARAVDIFNIQNSFYSNKFFVGLTVWRRGFSVCSVFSVD